MIRLVLAVVSAWFSLAVLAADKTPAVWIGLITGALIAGAITFYYTRKQESVDQILWTWLAATVGAMFGPILSLLLAPILLVLGAALCAVGPGLGVIWFFFLRPRQAAR